MLCRKGCVIGKRGYDSQKTDKTMILQPAEDFSGRTLAAVPGVLGKLEYVTGLRGTSETYSHWGLTRSYGEATANQTIAGAHADIFIEVLRTPLSQLAEEVRWQADDRGVKAAEYAATLAELGERLIPQSLRGGSQRHFSSVLRSLSALANVPALRRSPTA
jgi:hypothetical protein